jgi:hypothetical protein
LKIGNGLLRRQQSRDRFCTRGAALQRTANHAGKEQKGHSKRFHIMRFDKCTFMSGPEAHGLLKKFGGAP